MNRVRFVHQAMIELCCINDPVSEGESLDMDWITRLYLESVHR